jgi:hypothetical protein
MLEQNIAELNKTVEKLIGVLGPASLATPVEPKPKAETPAPVEPKPKAETPAPVKEKAPKPEVEPVVVEAEPEPEADDDDDDDSDAAEWDMEEPSDMSIDDFRKALLPLGPAKGPTFLAKQGYKKVTDVPASERAVLAEAAKQLLGK